MLPGNVITILLSILVGLLLGVVAWGFLRVQWHKIGNEWMEPGNELLLELLVLAAFALGVFLTYALLGLKL
jgi:hypothetical protein